MAFTLYYTDRKGAGCTQTLRSKEDIENVFRSLMRQRLGGSIIDRQTRDIHNPLGGIEKHDGRWQWWWDTERILAGGAGVLYEWWEVAEREDEEQA